jgi:hypothetical protein
MPLHFRGDEAPSIFYPPNFSPHWAANITILLQNRSVFFYAKKILRIKEEKSIAEMKYSQRDELKE